MGLKFKFKHLNFHRFHQAMQPKPINYTLLFYLLNSFLSPESYIKNILTVTTLIWRARMRVTRAKHGDSLRSTSLAALTMDLRPRIILPLPPSSYGNLVNMVTTRFVAADSGGNSEVPELKDLVGL